MAGPRDSGYGHPRRKATPSLRDPSLQGSVRQTASRVSIGSHRGSTASVAGSRLAENKL